MGLCSSSTKEPSKNKENLIDGNKPSEGNGVSESQCSIVKEENELPITPAAKIYAKGLCDKTEARTSTKSNRKDSSMVSLRMDSVKENSVKREATLEEYLKRSSYVLDLKSNNTLDETEVEILSEQIKSINCSIEILDISFNEFKEDMLVKLFEGLVVNSSVVDLRLAGKEDTNRLFDNSYATAISKLCTLIESNQVIIHLDVTNLGLDASSMAKVLNSIQKNSKLKKVRLDENKLDEASCKALGKILESSKCISILSLRNCIPEGLSIEAIAKGISKNHSILDLDISGNLFNPKDLQSIYKSLISNNTITEFSCNGTSAENPLKMEKSAWTNLKEALLRKDSKIRNLSVRYNSIQEDSIEILKEILEKSISLERLDIGNLISPPEMKYDEVINTIKSSQGLKHINLDGNPLSSTGSQNLSDNLKENPRIVSVSLSGCFSNFDSVPFLENLSNLQNLKTLDFSNNQMDENTLVVLFQSLGKNVISLRIDNSKIGIHPAGELTKYISSNKSLRTLSLRDTGLRILELKEIVQAISESNISSLDLSSNTLSVGDKNHLNSLQILLTSRLKFIDLSANGLNDEDSMKFLSLGLQKNSTLETLDLSNNQISCTTAEYISTAMKYNTGLKELRLNNNTLKNQGIETIVKFLAFNTTLEKLDLSTNEIEDEGYGLIYESLKFNQILLSVNLRGNKLEKVLKDIRIKRDK